MSYSIYIGNAVLNIDEDGFGWKVERIEHPDAPQWPSASTFPDMSKATNGRHPGYSQMADFIRETGLGDLFNDRERGLLRSHPGIFPLTSWHVEQIEDACHRWERTHPGSEAGWGDERDHILARLIWYSYWMRWALENCEHPAVENY